MCSQDSRRSPPTWRRGKLVVKVQRGQHRPRSEAVGVQARHIPKLMVLPPRGKASSGRGEGARRGRRLRKWVDEAEHPTVDSVSALLLTTPRRPYCIPESAKTRNGTRRAVRARGSAGAGYAAVGAFATARPPQART